jgi:hypothetical protein
MLDLRNKNPNPSCLSLSLSSPYFSRKHPQISVAIILPAIVTFGIRFQSIPRGVECGQIPIREIPIVKSRRAVRSEGNSPRILLNFGKSGSWLVRIQRGSSPRRLPSHLRRRRWYWRRWARRRRQRRLLCKICERLRSRRFMSFVRA